MLELVGLYGTTPFAQPGWADQAEVTLGALTILDPPTQAEVQPLRDARAELADDVRGLSALIHALRGTLVRLGMLKGGA